MIGDKNVMDLSDAELSAVARRAAPQRPRSDFYSVAAAEMLAARCARHQPLPANRMFSTPTPLRDQPRFAQRAFEIARLTDAKIVRVFSYWRVTEPEAVFERVVDALQDLADQAGKHGLVIGLENEHACNIATAQETARVLAAIDHENLQVVWDPANAYISGEKPFPTGYRLLD